MEVQARENVSPTLEGRTVWRVICHTCGWINNHHQRKNVYAAGVEHQTSYDDHLVTVEWQE